MATGGLIGMTNEVTHQDYGVGMSMKEFIKSIGRDARATVIRLYNFQGLLPATRAHPLRAVLPKAVTVAIRDNANRVHAIGASLEFPRAKNIHITGVLSNNPDADELFTVWRPLSRYPDFDGPFIASVFFPVDIIEVHITKDSAYIAGYAENSDGRFVIDLDNRPALANYEVREKLLLGALSAIRDLLVPSKTRDAVTKLYITGVLHKLSLTRDWKSLLQSFPALKVLELCHSDDGASGERICTEGDDKNFAETVRSICPELVDLLICGVPHPTPESETDAAWNVLDVLMMEEM